MAWLNATLVVPDPSELPPERGARVPKLSLHVPGLTVAYRNQPIVASPPGFAEPFSCPVVPERSVAALVVTTGAAAGVVNERSDPNDVPYVFRPMAQK